MSTKRRLLALTIVTVLLAACSPPPPPTPPPAPAPPPPAPSADALRDAVVRFKTAHAPDARLEVFEVQVEARPGGCRVWGAVSGSGLADGLRAELLAVPLVTAIDDELEVLPSTALGERVRALVTVPVATLGIAPGRNQGRDAVTQAVLGDPLVVLRERDGWYQVRMTDQYLGWIAGGEVTRLTPTELEAWLGRDLVEVHTPAYLTRDAAGSQLLARAWPGVRLPLVRTEGGMVVVMTPDQTEAFIRSSAVRPHAAQASASRDQVGPLLELAKSYLGVPYLWAGTTPAGFDCSGFVQRVYSLFSHTLPRDSDLQLAAGVPVEREDLRPGDLVFFARQAGETRPNHVGLYLGEGEVIHASSSQGKVAINSLVAGAPRYDAGLDARYCGARRVLR